MNVMIGNPVYDTGEKAIELFFDIYNRIAESESFHELGSRFNDLLMRKHFVGQYFVWIYHEGGYFLRQKISPQADEFFPGFVLQIREEWNRIVNATDLYPGQLVGKRLLN